MKKLLAIATVLSLAVSGAALANTTVQNESATPSAQTHLTAKNTHHAKVKAEKKAHTEKTNQGAKTAK